MVGGRAPVRSKRQADFEGAPRLHPVEIEKAKALKKALVRKLESIRPMRDPDDPGKSDAGTVWSNASSLMSEMYDTYGERVHDALQRLSRTLIYYARHAG